MSVCSVQLTPVVEGSLSLPGNITCRYGLAFTDSILVFLSVGGSVIPIHIMESDSIASVKMRIQNSIGFFRKKQKLVFEGRELSRNNSRLRDYGVAEGDILHLIVRLSDLQVITVKTVGGKVFTFHVERGRNVGYVKQKLAKKEKGFVDLEDQQLICDGEELEDQRLINDISKSEGVVIHLLVQTRSAKVRATPIEKDFQVTVEALNLNDKNFEKAKPSKELQVLQSKLLRSHKDFILKPLIVNSKIGLPFVLNKLIDLTFDGLESGNQPIQSSEGCGGVYFMQDSSGQKYVSVFKPIDEEPMAVNNPQGLPLSEYGEGLKKGTRVGEGAFREVAAYLLDHPMAGARSLYNGEKGFSGVPPTMMVKCLHKAFSYRDGYQYAHRNVKIGSLQMFVENIGSCENMGPRAFPLDEVHKISVLDIRLANADRHAGNILVTRENGQGQIVLVPIDHGYCLPENFEDCTFEWLYWPQAQESYSPAIIEYIKSLDAEQDIELLKLHGWDIPPACARTLRISTMLLKKGAERGLTPFAIGSIMCRETLNKESVIEQIVREAEETVHPRTSKNAFLKAVALIMDRHLDELGL
ncbi:hypothetical protein SLEP1_g3282 [Rubroshorea leprosula]|uniref:1-phosphatidylinositol 4-kinase n=1 Tax=Rubroshorea leprosula TaxID=152421 RepID=A0AAV5HJU4_9ROSI|nr:hypothetical protein SLEP1_g3282 [Rubroshorea leprosula]